MAIYTEGYLSYPLPSPPLCSSSGAKSGCGLRDVTASVGQQWEQQSRTTVSICWCAVRAVLPTVVEIGLQRV